MIDPKKLRRIRKEKSMTQEDLATKSGHDVQTISRIERGKIEQSKPETIARLAQALGVEQNEIMKKDVPENDIERLLGVSAGSVGIAARVSHRVHNSYTLLRAQSGLTITELLELAPLALALVMKASLASRQANLEEWERRTSAVEEMRERFPHLPAWGVGYRTEPMDYERESIKAGDVFGRKVADAPMDFNDDEDNVCPFLTYLFAESARLDAEEKDIAVEDHGRWHGNIPCYRVGMEKAREIAGGDERAAQAIAYGQVLLMNMPKEVRSGQPEDRARWILGQLPEPKESDPEELDF